MIAAEHEGASMGGKLFARVLLLEHGNDDLARREVLDELVDRPEERRGTVRVSAVGQIFSSTGQIFSSHYQIFNGKAVRKFG